MRNPQFSTIKLQNIILQFVFLLSEVHLQQLKNPYRDMYINNIRIYIYLLIYISVNIHIYIYMTNHHVNTSELLIVS